MSTAPNDPAASAPATDESVLLAAIAGRRLAVVGYGNQGRAHARNLRDAGLDVVIGARAGGRGEAAARGDGFTPCSAAEATAGADLVILGLPDEAIPGVYAAEIAPALAAGATVGFMHGFAIHYDRVRPAAGIGVVMLAPKGPGDTLRARYERGEGIPGLLALHTESARGDAMTLARGWAAGIGCARAAIIPTTFADETETDLFGEQAVLCGGLLALVRTAYHTLVRAGYPRDLAYMECVQEVKQVADLLYAHGLPAMLDRISNTAEFGAHVAAERFAADGHLQTAMDELLVAIRDGRFADRLRDDHAAGFPWFAARRADVAADSIEDAGAEVRDWMPWLRAADGP
jgi:ketol-acid reductoisomerase